ncbi:MAG: CPBP family intramembrane metalloprotease [Desulfurococcales archaeon]|nr:CPBP family intramembrane metalloprotease [Desulfurococcales archaeon]
MGRRRAAAIIVYAAVAYGAAYTLDYTLILPRMQGPRNSLSILPLLLARMTLPAAGAFAALAVDGSLREWRRRLGLSMPRKVWVGLAIAVVVGAYTVSLPISVLLGTRMAPCGALEAMAQDSGMPAAILVALLLAAGIAAGATVNAFAALGEELGWRGYLHDRLRGLGVGPAGLAVGVAWALWHAPLVAAGYNYVLPLGGSCGAGARGAVAVGVFTLTLAGLGIVLEALRRWSGSVYVTAVAHGTMNGVAGLYALLVDGPRLVAPPAGLSVAAAFAVTALALAVWGRARL